ncbi:MAG: D-alanine--D-alanine ligase family protein [Acidimicrobiales bacterium]
MSNVAVIFGGPSPEHDVSILTGLQAAHALASSGETPVAIYWSKSGEMFDVPVSLEASAFLDGPPSRAGQVRLVAERGGGFARKRGGLGSRERPLGIDVVVNCCHGGPGEDGTLQAALDMAGIAYTGPTVASAALGMDKLAFGALMKAIGAPALDRSLLSPALPVGFEGPYIVKPRFGGSSIGIEVVEDSETAYALLATSPHLASGGVIEPYRPELFDLQIAVRSWPELEASEIEKPLRGAGAGPVLGYADKYMGGEGMVSAPRELPAVVSAEVAKQVRELAMQVAVVAGARGVARIDFLSDGSEVLVNEVNTIPGSLSKYLWTSPELPFGRLLAGMLEEAMSRPTHAYTSAGADGTALRSAGSIAAKLG